MNDTNERSCASRGSHGDAVHAAAFALYEAGRWVSADVPREKADAMWATLRDALGLRPGHATARGVDGGGGTKPTLTDEERGALRHAEETTAGMLHVYTDERPGFDISEKLRGLRERLG